MSASATWVRRLLPWAGVLLSLLSLAGCAYHFKRVTRSSAGAPLDRSEPSPDLVKVVTAEDVDRPYRQIGMVHAPASLSERDAIAALKKRARTLGGDALLGVRRQGPGATAGQASASLAEAPWEAAVIVWTDGKAGGAPTPAPGAPP